MDRTLSILSFATVPFGVGVGLYGGSCWSSQLTPWGWQRGWVCDYGYYGYLLRQA